MSQFETEHNIGDVPPGLIDAEDRTIAQRIESYLIGFVIAAALTVAAFYLLSENVVWGPAIPVAIAVLAVAQIGIHLVFFLHVTTDPDNTNTVMALGFGVLIVALIIAGSLWIMAHLNHNMLPVDQIMQMQR